MDFNKSPRVSSDEQGESREDWEPYLTDYREDGQYLHVPLSDIAHSREGQKKLEQSTTGFSAEYARAGDNAESFLTGVMPHEGVGQEVADDNTNTNTNAKVETKGESQMPELEQGDAYEQLSESEKLEAE